MSALDPYEAVMLVSYGGPRGPEDVLPFMRNATRGRGIPDERLVEVSGHYHRFGGVSPINERNAELMAALASALAERGVDVPLVIGNRNWTPYVADTLGELTASGVRRAVCVFTAAYASYSGCRQYREDLAGADSPVELDKIPAYAETPGFVTANADALVAALSRFGSDAARARVLFVTHSIPEAMNLASGPGEPAWRYDAAHRRVAQRVAAEASGALGFEPTWELVFCSRSGAPHIPWLEPDINDRLAELAAEGVTHVVAAPIGFINDHMEVVFDLDTQARETATELELGYERAATAGVHPAFVAELADALLVRAARARGEVAPDADAPAFCSPVCCGSGRPRPERPHP